MDLELAAGDPPSLPPIRTSVDATSAAEPVEADSGFLPAPKPSPASGQEDSGQCVTPKRPPPLVCPPAPRKPRPAKRKFAPPAAGFYPVPGDLAAVFVPLPRPAAASKKIRVG